MKPVLRHLLRSLGIPLFAIAALVGAAGGMRGASTASHCALRHTGAQHAEAHEADTHRAAAETSAHGTRHGVPPADCPHCPASNCAIAAPCATVPSILAALTSLPALQFRVPARTPYPALRIMQSTPRSPPVPPPDIRLG